MPTKVIERYFFFGLLFLTLLFSFLIFRPFWTVLVLGVSFAIVLYPLYEWLLKNKLSGSWASLITVFCFTVILLGPIFGIGAIIFKQSESVYHAIVDNPLNNSFLDNLDNAVDSILPAGFDFNVKEKFADSVAYLSQNIAGIFQGTISAFFSFFLMLLVMFYLLKDGERWKKAIIALSPLSDKDDEKIISRLRLAVNGVITGSLLIALTQGILMGLGLFIFGIPNFALWGTVAAIASLLPTIGTALVSIPAVIYLLITGSLWAGLGLLIWAVVIVGLVDNFLAPVLISKKIDIPSLLILFSVLGGIVLLGPVGILVGPLTMSLLYTLISIYRNEFRQNASI